MARDLSTLETPRIILPGFLAPLSPDSGDSNVANAFLEHLTVGLPDHLNQLRQQDNSRAWWKELGKFWESPASIRGFHRPKQTQGDHARRVFSLACRFWRRVPWNHIRLSRRVFRSFLRAALFHDVGKITDRQRHELEGFRWMLPRDPLAAFFILHHMGRWSCLEKIEKDLLIKQSGLAHLATPEHVWLCDLLSAADYAEACCWDLF